MDPIAFLCVWWGVMLHARRGCVGCNADDMEAHDIVVAMTFTLADEEERCGNNEGHKLRAAPRWRPL